MHYFTWKLVSLKYFVNDYQEFGLQLLQVSWWYKKRNSLLEFLKTKHLYNLTAAYNNACRTVNADNTAHYNVHHKTYFFLLPLQFVILNRSAVASKKQ